MLCCVVEDDYPPIAAASMWTRKDVKEFKDSLKKDKDSVIKVGSGETVTVSIVSVRWFGLWVRIFFRNGWCSLLNRPRMLMAQSIYKPCHEKINMFLNRSDTNQARRQIEISPRLSIESHLYDPSMSLIILLFVMPPTSEEVEGAIGLGLSVQ